MINGIPFSPPAAKATPQSTPDKTGRKANLSAAKESPAKRPETSAPPYQTALAPSAATNETTANLLGKVQEYLLSLQKRHPNFSFSFVDLTNKKDMQDHALSLGKGFHAVLSKTFLKKMTVDANSFAEGKSLIESALKRCIEKNDDANTLGQGLIVQPNGDTAFWTLRNPPSTPDSTRHEALKDTSSMATIPSNGEKRNRIAAFTFQKRLNYRPGSDLRRLASMKTTAQTNSFIMGVQMNISKIKLDSFIEEKEMKRAVAQMKQVIQRARTKIANLQREEAIAKQSRNAAKNQEIERAIALAKEVKRRQQTRKNREYAQVHDPLHPLPGTVYDKDENKSVASSENGALGMNLPAPIPIPEAPAITAAPACEGTAVPAVDISV